jgi:hypothetical protein
MSDLYSSSARATLLAVVAVLVAFIVYPFFITRSRAAFRPLVFLSFPMLVIIAWNGYPLAYYKLTGRRFIRYMDPSTAGFSGDYAVIDCKIYKHRGYDKENMHNSALTPEQRGYEPCEQVHERLIFRYPLTQDPNAELRFRGELSKQNETDYRWQTFWRVVFIFIIIVMSEPWFRALGTSWLRLFDA